ncbi:Geranylgeranyl transferase type-1 subunit beta [Geranomyces variabilis]|nr:Geranylgeranyl transferase type-1 subunit beta [Geranomyces variabilis]
MQLLPHHYTSTDPNRMTVAYFCLGALDLLGETPQLSPKTSQECIDWIYAQQIHPVEDSDDGMKTAHCGFRGGPSLGAPYSPQASTTVHKFDNAHITMTYTALASLLILRDDLSRVDKSAITDALRQLQQSDGRRETTRQSIYDGAIQIDAMVDESDMRFLYCACVISYILNDWRGMDQDKAVQYIFQSQSYESAFGQGPGQEAHGGSTYCAVASLQLLGKLHLLPRRDDLVYWLLSRQKDGFNGRPNKASDTCYSFWVGATLQMLGAYQFVDTVALKAFLQLTHSKHGGFGKEAGDHPDLLHSYLGLSGIAIAKLSPDVHPLNTALGLSRDTEAYLKITSAWSNSGDTLDGITKRLESTSIEN